jgi:lipoic acid synthetase
VPYRGAPARASVRRALRQAGLHTVCEGARCPNLCECWAAGTATFLILGSTCTRDCRFCAVPHGPPATVAADEPERLAAAARALGLRFVVLTSVTRDDLRDGGAAHFAACIRAIRGACPQAGIEVLVPDFRGSADAQAAVLEAGADVFNHNLETCRRLSPEVRPQADYARSLEVLARAARHTPAPLVKSGFMLGMGETAEEVREMLADLRRAGVRALTIGQYLPPSPRHWPLARYVPPADFAACERRAREEFGFPFVASGPRVRSSYRAEEAFRQGRVGGAKRERTAEETVG